MAKYVRRKRKPRFYWAEIGFLLLGLIGLKPSIITELFAVRRIPPVQASRPNDINVVDAWNNIQKILPWLEAQAGTGPWGGVPTTATYLAQVPAQYQASDSTHYPAQYQGNYQANYQANYPAYSGYSTPNLLPSNALVSSPQLLQGQPSPYNGTSATAWNVPASNAPWPTQQQATLASNVAWPDARVHQSVHAGSQSAAIATTTNYPPSYPSTSYPPTNPGTQPGVNSWYGVPSTNRPSMGRY